MLVEKIDENERIDVDEITAMDVAEYIYDLIQRQIDKGKKETDIIDFTRHVLEDIIVQLKTRKFELMDKIIRGSRS